MTPAVLEGLRVIDCASGLAGSVAALMLAEAGAETIKVEPPAGDPRRGSAEFAVWNRSKRGIALDPACEPDSFAALLRGADVLIYEGQDPPSDLSAHPHLITCAIGAVPPGHADGGLPLDDLIVMAASGILSEQAAIAREGPPYIRFPLGSWCAAWLAAVGIAARVLDVRGGGVPGPVDTSLLQGAMVPLMMLWRHAEQPSADFDGRIDKTVLPSLFECADGVWLHIMKNADDTPLMHRLLDAMGPAGVAIANAQWPRHFRYINWGANVRAFRSRPSAEWLQDLWAADIPVQPALPMGKLYADPQAQANGYAVEVDDPLFGKVRQPGFPVTMNPPGRVKGPVPGLDADRADLLARARERTVVAAKKDSDKPFLDGVRILDFGQYLAGPLATMLLADLGAEVIKIEAPGGDPMRSNESAFLGCQRGKRSLALDLKHPRATEVIERLVRRSDVVHHNLRMPSARRFGLHYEALKTIRPDIVFGHVSAYGPQGPRRYWPGYDQLFQASTGWELANAGHGNRPTWLRFGMMDHLCAMSLAYGILLALIRRQATGEGSEIAASLLGTSMMTMSELMMREDGTLTDPGPALDAAQLGVSPGRRLARCSDGWIALTGPDESAPATRELAALTVADALALLATRGFVAVHVRSEASGREFLFDPGNIAAGLVARYPHRLYGELRHPGAFWTLPSGMLRLDRAPPEIGQHSGEILEESGFSRAEIASLIEHGAVGASIGTRA